MECTVVIIIFCTPDLQAGLMHTYPKDWAPVITVSADGILEERVVTQRKTSNAECTLTSRMLVMIEMGISVTVERWLQEYLQVMFP